MTDLRQAAQQALEALGSGNPYHQQLAAKVLRTALEQQAEPPEWLLIKNILDEYGLQAIDFVAEFKAAQQQAEPVADEAIHAAWSAGYVEGEKAALEQQAEPTCPDCKAAVLYECVACSSNNYPPKQQAEPVAWTTMPEAEDWCFVSGNKDPTGKLEGKWFPLYTTPPQRQWVGLEAEDLAQIENDEFWQTGNHMAIAVAVEAKLKERNGY